MSEKRQGEAVSAIVAHARKHTRQKIKTEIARTNREKKTFGLRGG